MRRPESVVAGPEQLSYGANLRGAVRSMRLGIDASNIRLGGGVTHLTRLLEAADPPAHGFESVIVWAPRATLARLKDAPWLSKRHEPVLESNFLRRAIWQALVLGSRARSVNCDVLFVPGGSFATAFRPVVTMSQNLLPFEPVEMRHFGWSTVRLRLELLRRAQSRSFRSAAGMIFLTRFARSRVEATTGALRGRVSIIPHGIDPSFASLPRDQQPVSFYNESRPLRIVYVSIVDMYKHQWCVATAVGQLREAGLPVSLELIGPAYPPALGKVTQVFERFDPQGRYMRYSGSVPHEELPARYAAADLCVFASSCENLPNILIEAMAAGLPIACSDRSSMPEVLGDAGVYFDPEDPAAIAQALGELIQSPQLRAAKARAAFERAGSYTWARCARETFDFLAQCAE